MPSLRPVIVCAVVKSIALQSPRFCSSPDPENYQTQPDRATSSRRQISRKKFLQPARLRPATQTHPRQLSRLHCKMSEASSSVPELPTPSDPPGEGEGASQQYLAWGKQVSDQISRGNPKLAFALAADGIAADPTALLQQLKFSATLSSAMQAIFNTADKYMAYLEQEFEKQKEETQTYLKKLADVATKTSNAASSAKRRLTENPTKFTGEEKDPAERQVAYINWRSKVGRNIVTDADYFDSDFKQLQYIASMLDGKAYREFQPRFDKLTELRDKREEWPWQNTTALVAELNTIYITMDLSRAAKRDLEKLWMKNTPFPTFVAKFQSLATEAGKTPEQKVDELKKRVNKELADHMRLASIKDTPAAADLPGWIEFFQNAWDKDEEHKHFSEFREGKVPGQSRPFTQTQNPSPSQQQAQAKANQGDPMQLDAARQGRPDKSTCIAMNLCYYCKKPGHGIADCAERVANDAAAAAAGRGRGDFSNFSAARGRGRGFGTYNGGIHRNAFNNFQQFRNQSPTGFQAQYPQPSQFQSRLRQIDYDVDSDTSSPAPSSSGGTSVTGKE